MRDISTRRFYCEKAGRMVTVVEFARCIAGHEVIRGILDCSEQEDCAIPQTHGDSLYPWGTCPACADLSREGD